MAPARGTLVGCYEHNAALLVVDSAGRLLHVLHVCDVAEPKAALAFAHRSYVKRLVCGHESGLSNDGNGSGS